jgi:hypothetical protein
MCYQRQKREQRRNEKMKMKTEEIIETKIKGRETYKEHRQEDRRKTNKERSK